MIKKQCPHCGLESSQTRKVDPTEEYSIETPKGDIPFLRLVCFCDKHFIYCDGKSYPDQDALEKALCGKKSKWINMADDMPQDSNIQYIFVNERFFCEQLREYRNADTHCGVIHAYSFLSIDTGNHGLYRFPFEYVVKYMPIKDVDID